MGDAGAVFLAAFGLLVFGQLALEFAGGSAVIGRAEAARIAAVALLGGAVTALGWEVERQRRARRRRDPVEAGAGTVETSPDLIDGGEELADPETAPEPTAAGEAVSRAPTRRWWRVWG